MKNKLCPLLTIMMRTFVPCTALSGPMRVNIFHLVLQLRHLQSELGNLCNHHLNHTQTSKNTFFFPKHNWKGPIWATRKFGLVTAKLNSVTVLWRFRHGSFRLYSVLFVHIHLIFAPVQSPELAPAWFVYVCINWLSLLQTLALGSLCWTFSPATRWQSIPTTS